MYVIVYYAGGPILHRMTTTKYARATQDAMRGGPACERIDEHDAMSWIVEGGMHHGDLGALMAARRSP